ncbi:hypothetical protein [Ruegeria faecimaris]|uniref:hypothetical protein n=1 Tax=Ruegeria faecimaris TaxID=686389 RepID=UPI002491714C|nr:hypothetical protein [Ruegeria faecimaris]
MRRKLKRRLEKWQRSAQKISELLRKRIRKLYKTDYCVIVASNGRSGSTMTYHALRDALERLDPNLSGQASFVSRLDDATFQAPFLYKTHDFPQVLSNWSKDTRVVFCFGSTKDSTFSVYTAMEGYGPEWIKKHFYNLHATGTYDELFERDVLQQARQIKEWVTYDDIPVLCVHYNALWEYQDEISEFTGLKFVPAPRRERAEKDIPEDLRKAASQIYDPIDEVISQLPRCFVASPEMNEIVGKLPLAK